MEPYRRMIGDPQVLRHIGVGARYRIKRVAARMLAWVSDYEARRAVTLLADHWRVRGYGEWAVEEKTTGALVGQVGLVHHPDWFADEAKIEVGWLLARSAWGRGFATEAGRASLAFAFEQLGLERIVSITRPANFRSERVMKRLGMTYVGDTSWKGGAVIWYAMTRVEWNRLSLEGAPSLV